MHTTCASGGEMSCATAAAALSSFARTAGDEGVGQGGREEEGAAYGEAVARGEEAVRRERDHESGAVRHGGSEHSGERCVFGDAAEHVGAGGGCELAGGFGVYGRVRSLADDVAEVSRRVRSRVDAAHHPQRRLAERGSRLSHKLRHVVHDASPHGGGLPRGRRGDRAVDAHEEGRDGRGRDAPGADCDRRVRGGGDHVELVVGPRRERTAPPASHGVSIVDSQKRRRGVTSRTARIVRGAVRLRRYRSRNSPSTPPRSARGRQNSGDAPTTRPPEVRCRLNKRVICWHG